MSLFRNRPPRGPALSPIPEERTPPESPDPFEELNFDGVSPGTGELGTMGRVDDSPAPLGNGPPASGGDSLRERLEKKRRARENPAGEQEYPVGGVDAFSTNNGAAASSSSRPPPPYDPMLDVDEDDSFPTTGASSDAAFQRVPGAAKASSKNKAATSAADHVLVPPKKKRGVRKNSDKSTTFKVSDGDLLDSPDHFGAGLGGGMDSAMDDPPAPVGEDRSMSPPTPNASSDKAAKNPFWNDFIQGGTKLGIDELFQQPAHEANKNNGCIMPPKLFRKCIKETQEAMDAEAGKTKW